MSAILLTLLTVLPQAGPDTVVVCPDGFREALGPWLEHRGQQGHSIVLVSNMGSLDEIRGRIREAAKGGRLRFVVLVGDAVPGSDRDRALRARCVPTYRAKAEVNVLWGSPPHIATDNWFADLDDDQVPDVAIGRLTADTPGQLSQIVAKILAYERSRDFGPWRRRLNFVAGIGGFGVLTDMVIERTTRLLLTSGIPAEYRVSMTYGSWRSPYCPDPRLFHESTLKRLNEGSWFWIYIGHGFHLGLDRVRVPDVLPEERAHHILGVDDVPKLDCRQGAPIALFLACYTGAFDAEVDCLAERMLCRQGGPVAVIASSRVAMPYAMAVMATGLMDQCLKHRTATLGEAVLRAKQAMIKGPAEGDHRRAMLDVLAKVVSPAPEKLPAERAEHLLLFNLIGDPLLRLHYPKNVKLQVPATVAAGGRMSVTGTSEVDGRAVVELVVPLNRLTFKPPGRYVYPQTSAALAEFQETYQRANDHRLVSVEVPVDGGRFAAGIEVPPEVEGICHVRVFIRGVDDFAIGSAKLVVDKSEQPSSER